MHDLDFDTVLDACGGSGVVSYFFKKAGKSVTYNDKLKFNALIGKALIENQGTTFTDEDLDNLLQSFNDNTDRNFIERTFRGIYYLNHENRWLDRMNGGIINMNHYVAETLEFKKSLAYYALIQACIIKRPFNLFHRKNLNLRTNDVERNFGNKATWDKSFESHFRTFINEANELVFNSNTHCQATNESIFDLDERGYDLVYIDPPYLNADGSNETSDYLKCYHFLEGMCNYDQWNSMMDKKSINKRFHSISEQNDFKKETIYQTFEEIISKYRESTIILSYKLGGLPSINFLKELMGRYKRRVYTRSQQYNYALNRQNGNAKKNREVLIIGV